MKKMILVLVIVCGFLCLTAEEQVTIKEVEGFWVAAMDFTGPYTKMEANIGQYMSEFFKQGLVPGGSMVGIYTNSTKEVKEEELKWAIGFQVAPETKVETPLVMKHCEPGTAAVYLHIGPYEQLDKAFEKITKHIEENGYKIKWPTYDKYLNNPQQVKPEELQTLTIVPVEKK